MALFVSVTTALSNAKLSQEVAKHKGTIKLTNANYERILGGERQSHMVVLLTSTNPQIGCSLCVELEPEFNLLADSWYKDHPTGLSADGERGLFFAKADFDPKKNNEVFMQFKVNNVPRLLFLTPGQGLESFSQINLPGESGLPRVMAIISTLRDATGLTDFRVHQPINWGSVLTTTLATAVITILVKKYRSVAVSLVTSRTLWGLATVFLITLWISGYMFNSIRGSQFAGMSPDGSSVVYFLEGQQQNQFGIETQIVSVIYGVLASCTVGLISFVPYAKRYYANDKAGRPSPSKASFVELSLTLSFLVTLYLFYGALTGVFKLKSSGYPYKLFTFPLK